MSKYFLPGKNICCKPLEGGCRSKVSKTSGNFINPVYTKVDFWRDQIRYPRLQKVSFSANRLFITGLGAPGQLGGILAKPKNF
jgi:hypothetical protein